VLVGKSYRWCGGACSRHVDGVCSMQQSVKGFECSAAPLWDTARSWRDARLSTIHCDRSCLYCMTHIVYYKQHGWRSILAIIRAVCSYSFRLPVHIYIYINPRIKLCNHSCTGYSLRELENFLAGCLGCQSTTLHCRPTRRYLLTASQQLQCGGSVISHLLSHKPSAGTLNSFILSITILSTKVFYWSRIPWRSPRGVARSNWQAP